MVSVTAGGPGLVAVGFEASFVERIGAVWTSPDGIEWTRVPHDQSVFGGDGNPAMLSVTAGGPGLVAVGEGRSGDDAVAAVWTSSDGIAWSRVPHDQSVFGGDGDRAMWSVTAGGPGLVAVGEGGSRGDRFAAVWTSPDGITWSRVPHDQSVFGGGGFQEMTHLTAGGPGLVAVGDDRSGTDVDAAVWTSPDGIAWSRVPHDQSVFGGDGNQFILGVTSNGSGLVAVGEDRLDGDSDAAVWTSPDGTTWSRVRHDEAVFGGEDTQVMLAVTSDSIGLVAVGTDEAANASFWSSAAVWTSPEGVIWSRVPHDEEVFGGIFSLAMLSVTAGGPGLVAVGQEDPSGNLAAWVARPEN
jgi:hypothetical protein